jgi:hypothetical protein
MQFFIVFIIVCLIISFFAQFWYLFPVGIAAFFAPRVIRHIRMKKYFASEEFLKHKQEIQSVVQEHNEISSYVDEIRETGTFTIGESSTGSNAHLATFSNTSKHDYKRDRNVAVLGAKNVHNASLQVVRNASVEPIKYLIKYFDIEATEDKLTEVEALGESISRLESAIANLQEREESISETFAPPEFIVKYYLKEFQQQVGLNIPPLEIPYPKYVFQYLSAGGNSGQTTEVPLNSSTTDALIEALSSKIKFKQSAAGQRSLMTARFRTHIKQRDNFTCKACTISIYDEPHLLLEVDHMVPVSKGGLSIETNLQTLCWKCNRSKSNKLAI